MANRLAVSFMLGVVKIGLNAECRYAECRSASIVTCLA